MRSTMDLKRIASSGAGLILDCSQFSTLDIKTIVGCAKGPVTLKNVKELSTMDLKAIVAAGSSQVIIDLCD